MIPGPQAHYRCCIYKEREIIKQRVRLAEGKCPVGQDVYKRQVKDSYIPFGFVVKHAGHIGRNQDKMCIRDRDRGEGTYAITENTAMTSGL